MHVSRSKNIRKQRFYLNLTIGALSYRKRERSLDNQKERKKDLKRVRTMHGEEGLMTCFFLTL